MGLCWPGPSPVLPGTRSRVWARSFSPAGRGSHQVTQQAATELEEWTKPKVNWSPLINSSLETKSKLAAFVKQILVYNGHCCWKLLERSWYEWLVYFRFCSLLTETWPWPTPVPNAVPTILENKTSTFKLCYFVCAVLILDFILLIFWHRLRSFGLSALSNVMFMAGRGKRTDHRRGMGHDSVI